MTLLGESIVVGAVAYRLWRLVAVDDITMPLRQHIARSAWATDLVGCPWCSGTWITAAAVLVAWLFGWTDSSPWLLIPAGSVVCGTLGEHL